MILHFILFVFHNLRNKIEPEMFPEILFSTSLINEQPQKSFDIETKLQR